MTEILKPCSRGEVSVSHIELTQSDVMLSNLLAIMDGVDFMVARPGKYARLHIRGELVMSDTQMEQRTNREFVCAANGAVLIGGLGIGLVLPPILAKPQVHSVLVVEKEPDVINLISESFRNKKLTVVLGDVHTYEPQQKFDTIWLDIWPNICTDNLPEMVKLKRRYLKWLNGSGWIGCWSEHELRKLKRRR